MKYMTRKDRNQKREPEEKKTGKKRVAIPKKENKAQAKKKSRKGTKAKKKEKY